MTKPSDPRGGRRWETVAMPQDFVEMSVDDLEMLLAEWQQWRDRVLTAETMRLRLERFKQACAQVAAIEAELRLRSPDVRERMLREATARVRDLAAGPTVPLDAFRSAVDERLAIEKREPRRDR